MRASFNRPKRAYYWLFIVLMCLLLVVLLATNANTTQTDNGPADKGSRFAGPTNVLALFTPIALAPKLPPEMSCRCYLCPQKSVRLEGCTLQKVVSAYGPPDKVHYMYYRSADVQVYTGV